jgi:hypothetical protein
MAAAGDGQGTEAGKAAAVDGYTLGTTLAQALRLLLAAWTAAQVHGKVMGMHPAEQWWRWKVPPCGFSTQSPTWTACGALCLFLLALLLLLQCIVAAELVALAGPRGIKCGGAMLRDVGVYCLAIFSVLLAFFLGQASTADCVIGMSEERHII